MYIGNLKEEIQKYISLDQLPGMYGGERFEPDAECSDYINSGQDVPLKFHRSRRLECGDDDGMERVVVRRGSFHKVRHEVPIAGCVLQWEFFTDHYDVAYKVSLTRIVAGKKKKQTIVRNV